MISIVLQFSLSELAKAILNTLPRAWIVPVERALVARDDARATLEAAIGFGVNQPICFQCVDARGTDPRTKSQLALCLADFLIECDMACGVNLKDIETELGFDIDGH
jgi:hypothetical protein